MSHTSNLPLLTSANWYQWEQLALNSISVYGHAGRAIQTNQPYTAVEPCKPMRIFYLEEVENADMDIIVQQSSRLWNDATDWPLYNKAKEEYYVSQQRYQHDKQALWSYLLTQIDSDVDHLIKLHPDYAEAKIGIQINYGLYYGKVSINMAHLMHQKSKLNGLITSNLHSILKEIFYLLFPWLNISLDFKIMSIISAAILSSLPTLNAQRLFSPVSIRADTPTSGISIMGLHPQSQPTLISKLSSYNQIKIKSLFRTSHLSMLQQCHPYLKSRILLCL